jgi:hypothetical protein
MSNKPRAPRNILVEELIPPHKRAEILSFAGRTATAAFRRDIAQDSRRRRRRGRGKNDRRKHMTNESLAERWASEWASDLSPGLTAICNAIQAQGGGSFRLKNAMKDFLDAVRHDESIIEEALRQFFWDHAAWCDEEIIPILRIREAEKSTK